MSGERFLKSDATAILRPRKHAAIKFRAAAQGRDGERRGIGDELVRADRSPMNQIRRRLHNIGQSGLAVNLEIHLARRIVARLLLQAERTDTRQNIQCDALRRHRVLENPIDHCNVRQRSDDTGAGQLPALRGEPG